VCVWARVWAVWGVWGGLVVLPCAYRVSYLLHLCGHSVCVAMRTSGWNKRLFVLLKTDSALCYYKARLAGLSPSASARSSARREYSSTPSSARQRSLLR
jgi:hypothetical protein